MKLLRNIGREKSLAWKNKKKRWLSFHSPEEGKGMQCFQLIQQICAHNTTIRKALTRWEFVNEFVSRTPRLLNQHIFSLISDNSWMWEKYQKIFGGCLLSFFWVFCIYTTYWHTQLPTTYITLWYSKYTMCIWKLTSSNWLEGRQGVNKNKIFHQVSPLSINMVIYGLIIYKSQERFVDCIIQKKTWKCCCCWAKQVLFFQQHNCIVISF